MTGTFTDLAPVREVTQRLDDAGIDFCFCTDNPAFNGRYLQAEHEVAARERSHRLQRPGAVSAQRLQARVLTSPARNPCQRTLRARKMLACAYRLLTRKMRGQRTPAKMAGQLWCAAQE